MLPPIQRGRARGRTYRPPVDEVRPLDAVRSGARRLRQCAQRKVHLRGGEFTDEGVRSSPARR
eukprot:7469711-Pyramimonas_sp.AAC.1